MTFFCLKAEILRHLYRFICTFLTKAACCRNIEIVLHPTTLSYICTYVNIYIYVSFKTIYIYIYIYIYVNIYIV